MAAGAGGAEAAAEAVTAAAAGGGGLLSMLLGGANVTEVWETVAAAAGKVPAFVQTQLVPRSNQLDRLFSAEHLRTTPGEGVVALSFVIAVLMVWLAATLLFPKRLSA